MSRSSKGFADFFPTAPSVLQQKRSKEFRKISPSPLKDCPRPPSHKDFDRISSANGFLKDDINSMAGTFKHDEAECSHGDFGHEAGSASSTSTASSNSKLAQHTGVQKSTTLTPLTNIDSSPRTYGIRSPQKRALQQDHFSPVPSPGSPSRDSLSKYYSPISSESDCTPQPSRPQARPGKGEIKGYQITFDPATDKTGKAKERKSREIQYEPFGQEVCSTRQAH